MYRNYGKRLFDLILAGLALISLAPVIVVVALLVRRRHGSPVFFRQPRLGRDGKPFNMLKFRTMTDDRDAGGALLPDAARITRFGGFLRRTSLDELPELWNVLMGEMSLVGPRPLHVRYQTRYTPEQMYRHAARPGITGWAQARGRDTLSWEERFACDVWYVDHQSFWLDIKVIGLTAWKVLRREGIIQGGYDTMPEFFGTAQPTEGGAPS